MQRPFVLLGKVKPEERLSVLQGSACKQCVVYALSSLEVRHGERTRRMWENLIANI